MKSDMSPAIVPKSDQLNADDLIAGEMTIRVSGVDIRGGQEQPVSIHFDGDNGKPYKPCKSMCRIMVAAWGADASKYVGRSMTLYRDPKVKWAGLEVGGIRISHMSHISDDMTMALTVTRSNRKPFTVRPLIERAAGTVSAPPTAQPPAESSAAEQSAVADQFISPDQCRTLLSYCEQTGVNISRVLLKAKAANIELIPADAYSRCIAFIDNAAKR